MPMDWKSTKIKVIGITLLCVLLLIVILQNTQAVETKILFVTVSMPRALLLFVTFLSGIVSGVILTKLFMSRKKKRDQRQEG